MVKGYVKQLTSLVLLGSLALLPACGSDSSGSTTPAASLAMKGTSGNAVNMNGTWTGCTFSSTDQQNEKTTIVLNGGSATASINIWEAASNANCTQTGTPDMQMAITASITMGTENTAVWDDGSGGTTPPAGITGPVNATSATMNFTSATATVNSANFITFLNGNAACGKTDWTAGVPVNVLNCSFFINSTTQTQYWVVDDSGSPLKWYSNDGAAWVVNSTDPVTK